MGSLTRCSRVRLPMGPQYRTGLPEAGSGHRVRPASRWNSKVPLSARTRSCIPVNPRPNDWSGGKSNAVVGNLHFRLPAGLSMVASTRVSSLRGGVPENVGHGFLDHAINGLSEQAIDLGLAPDRCGTST